MDTLGKRKPYRNQLPARPPQRARTEPKTLRPTKQQQPNPPRPKPKEPSQPLVSRIERIKHNVFEHIQQVGDGTYGKVYKSRNLRTGEIYALKRLKLEAEREGLPITAVREIKLLQKLKHNNIVNLTEMVVSQKETFMSFEYIENDLAGLLLNPALIITPSHIKSLFKQMMDALAYLHKNGIVHRDIKGSNILLDNTGKIKLADFGLARTIDLNDMEAHYTNRVITLWYRPPELLLGETQYSTEIDIWSMGCLFAELFVRKALFPGKDEVSELEEIYKVMGTPKPEDWAGHSKLPWYHLMDFPEYPGHFDKLFTGVSKECYKLCLSMLQMNPRKRCSAIQVLRHEYFSESPKPVPLQLQGEWHDFDAKQARKKN